MVSSWHLDPLQIVVCQIECGDGEDFRPEQSARVDAASGAFMEVVGLVGMAGEQVIGLGSQQGFEITADMTMDQSDASMGQFDFAAPAQTMNVLFPCRLFELRDRVGVVIAKGKIKREHRADRDDLRCRQVTTMKQRLGTRFLQQRDGPFGPFQVIV